MAEGELWIPEEWMKKISVGVADDHPVVLVGVSNLLKQHSDLEVRFTTDNVGALLELLRDQPVDVLLCDYEFEGDPMGDGLNLLAKIKRGFPHTRVLFLSAHAESYVVSGALEAGAAGFIGKNRADFANLAAAVRSAYQSDVYLSTTLAGRLLANMFDSNKKTVGLEALSEKEATVARMICGGLSITEVAEKLRRSPKTISNQKNAAMKKLGARNDVELAKVMHGIGGLDAAGAPPDRDAGDGKP